MVRAVDVPGPRGPRLRVGRLIVLLVMMGLLPTPSVAQAPAAPPPAGGAQPAAPAPTREALIEREQAAKVPTLKPYALGRWSCSSIRLTPSSKAVR